MNQEIGKIVKCGHCNGTGKCDCEDCNYTKNNHRRYSSEKVQCKTCKGSGSVWIGPQSISIIITNRFR